MRRGSGITGIFLQGVSIAELAHLINRKITELTEWTWIKALIYPDHIGVGELNNVITVTYDMIISVAAVNGEAHIRFQHMVIYKGHFVQCIIIAQTMLGLEK